MGGYDSVAGFAMDSERGHIFIPVTKDDLAMVLVTDLDGAVIASVGGLPGIGRPLLTEDRRSVVMAISNEDAIAVIDTTTLGARTVATEPGTCPSQITETGGGFWVVIGCDHYRTAVAHVDLASGAMTQFHRSDWPEQRPTIVASPSLPDTLVMASGVPARIDLLSASAEGIPSLGVRASREVARWGDRPTATVSPDGSVIAVASERRFVDLSSTDLAILSQTTVDDGVTSDVAFRADGWRAEVIYHYAGSRDYSTLVMRRPDGRVFRTFRVRNLSGWPDVLRSMAWGTRHLYTITGDSSLQVFEQRLASTLTIGLDQNRYEPGDVARVRMHLTSRSENRQVRLYATPAHRRRRLVASGNVDRHGDLHVRLTLRRNTKLEARFTGDVDNDPAVRLRAASVVSPVHNWLKGYQRITNGYAIYSPRDETATVVGESLRGRQGDALCFQLFRRRPTGWWYEDSYCGNLDRDLRSSVRIPLAYLGERLRVRAHWEGTTSYTTSYGPWKYFRLAR